MPKGHARWQEWEKLARWVSWHILSIQHTLCAHSTHMNIFFTSMKKQILFFAISKIFADKIYLLMKTYHFSLYWKNTKAQPRHTRHPVTGTVWRPWQVRELLPIEQGQPVVLYGQVPVFSREAGNLELDIKCPAFWDSSK